MSKIDKVYLESLKEAMGVFEGVKKQDLSVNPVIVYAKDFKSENGFAYAMNLCGKYFKDVDDVIVRYVKPENKETGEILVNFQVLKSKAKVFYKWFKEQTDPLYFVFTSNKEMKEGIKFLNSLGVKGDDGESIADYAEEMKAEFNPNETKVYVDIRMYDGIPTLSWSYVGKFYECDKDFNSVKELIKSILK